MRTITREIQISDDDTVEFHPFAISQDGNSYLIGVVGNKSYLHISRIGLHTVRLLEDGLTLGAAKKRLQETTHVNNLTFQPLLEKLLSAGMVRCISGQKTEISLRRGFVFPLRINPTRWRWLFSAPSLAVLIFSLCLAIWIASSQPWPLLKPAQILTQHRYWVLILLGLCIGFANAAKHELAHALAASYLGVTARFSIGRRFIWPVFQTDMTDLWTVERRKRYIAYAAGIASDAWTAIMILLLAWGSQRHILPQLHGGLLLLLTLAFYTCLANILWQFNIYVRTDVYYIFASLFNCRNLHKDATSYMKSLFKKIFSLPLEKLPATHFPFKVRIYALIVALGYFVASACCFFYLIGLATLWHSPKESIKHSVWIGMGVGDKAALALSLLISILLVIYAAYHEGRQEKIMYKIRDSEVL